MILSFAWTVEPLLARHKTCTRRDWSPGYVRQWQRAWDEGKLVHDAYDKSPRAGGHKIGEIRLTCRPYLERLGDMPEGDLEAEGGMWESKAEFIELQGGAPDKVLAVVRFRFGGS